MWKNQKDLKKRDRNYRIETFFLFKFLVAFEKNMESKIIHLKKKKSDRNKNQFTDVYVYWEKAKIIIKIF